MNNLIEKMWTYADDSYDGKIVKGNDKVTLSFIPNGIVIAFAGSDDTLDWVNNFRVDSFKEHRGFEDSFEKFKTFIDGIDYRGDEIYVTGHSRGAALATQCAEYFALRGIPCSCIAFGSPKVGGKSYRERYNKLPIDHTVVRNGWDIITCLPPLAFRHVGKVLRLKQPWYHRFMFWRVKDHFRSSYEKATKKYYKR